MVVDLDGSGQYQVETPIGFLTHMVEQLSKHGLFDLEVRATGDTHIDGHHTTEDLAIALGQAFASALGDKAGIRRYGSATLPMDEACVPFSTMGSSLYVLTHSTMASASISCTDAFATSASSWSGSEDSIT